MNPSGSSPQHMSVGCPACSQMLVVPTADLRGTIQCPRCQAVHPLGALIPAHTPIHAVVVSNLPPAPQPAPSPASPQPPNPILHAPPTPAAAPPRPDGVLTQAARLGERGTQTVSGFGHGLLDAADRVDRRMYGRRARWICITAMLAVLAVYIDDRAWPTAPILTVVFTFVFVAVLLVLGLAYIGAMRNDDGQWSAALTFRRLGESASAIGDSLLSIVTMPFALALKTTAVTMLSMGMIGLALRNFVVLFDMLAQELFQAPIQFAQDIAQQMSRMSMLPLGLGVLLWFVSLLFQPKARLAKPSADERRQLTNAVGTLPHIIDCNDKKHLQTLAARVEHPVLSTLLTLLSEWRPRDFDYEDQYQASLHRWLRKRFPESNPERERPIGQGTKKNAGRADLVLSDAVLIEMKRGLSTATAQKALGQMEMYAQLWKRGPVLLLICGAAPENRPDFFGPGMEKLHQHSAVTVLFAARPNRK